EIKALGGVTSDEELSDNFWTIAKGRFNWLLINLATAFLASSVLGLFEGQLEKMVALAVLAPIVASQGGNAATQTMTVAVRALATRELGSSNALRVTMRELLVGLVNGVGFAVITGIAAVLWFKIPGLGIVIGLAGPNTKIVPGHGPVVSRVEVMAHRDMLLAIRDRVSKLVSQGKTQEEVLAAHPTSEYDARVPNSKETTDRFLTQLYAEVKSAK
ncbi:MAG TPA: magnesium transporter, partial [Gemmataceae bacterium]|nr:magnesium transporter [Gemmataceae bacterium]